MSHRPYSSYLSKIDAPSSHSSYRSSTPTARTGLASPYNRRDDKYSSSIGSSYQSNYLRKDVHNEVRDESFTPSPVRSYNREGRTGGLSVSASSRNYDPVDKFKSDATINTGLLFDALNNELESSTQIGSVVGRRKMSPERYSFRSTGNHRSASRDSDRISLSPHTNSRFGDSVRRKEFNQDDERSTYRRVQRDASPVDEFVPQPTRPISPLDDRTISNNDYSQAQPRNGGRGSGGGSSYNTQDVMSRQRDSRDNDRFNSRNLRDDKTACSYRGRSDSYGNSYDPTPPSSVSRRLNAIPSSAGRSTPQRRTSPVRRYSPSSSGTGFDDRRRNENNQERRYSQGDSLRDGLRNGRLDGHDDQRRDGYADRRYNDHDDKRRDGYADRRYNNDHDQRRDGYADRRYNDHDEQKLDSPSRLSGSKYQDSFDDRRSNSRGSYRENLAALKDEIIHGKPRDFSRDIPKNETTLRYQDSFEDRRTNSRDYSKDNDVMSKHGSDHDRPTSAETNKTGTNTVMSFEVVRESGTGSIKLRTRNPSPMPSDEGDKISSDRTLYEFPASNTNQSHQQREKEDQQQIVINLSMPHADSPSEVRSKSGHVSMNYDDLLPAQSSAYHSVEDTQRPRGGLPPLKPSANNIYRGAENASIISDLSPIAGIPKTLNVVNGGRSVASNISNVSRWKTNDVVLLPKGHTKSEAAIAAAAAASIIVSEGGGTGGSFETAVKSISNMLVSNDEGIDDAASIVRPSVSHHDYNNLVDDALVPISFNKVKVNMKAALRQKMVHGDAEDNGGLILQIDASNFFARCAMLAATAIMKADPAEKAVIAQTAAETILSFHVAAMQSNDWLESADRDLRDVADEVSNAINALPIANNQAMASLASIAVLSEGGKSLALERIRQRMKPEPTLDIIEQTEEEEEEGDIISPIRNKGSLMDSLVDCDDSSDDDSFSPSVDKNVVTDREVSAGNRSIASFQARSLNVNTTNRKPEPPQEEILMDETTPQPQSDLDRIRDLRKSIPKTKDQERIQNAVRNLLESASDDESEVKPPVGPRVERHSKLDKKQEEISKRIQRIQMRAAGKSDQEIDKALGKIQTFSGDNISANIVMNYTDDSDNKRKYRRKKSTTRSRGRGLDEENDRSSAKDLMDGIGTMMTPVISYLEGFNMPSLNNLKIPSLPQCKMDDVDGQDDYNYEDSDDIQIEVDHGLPEKTRGIESHTNVDLQNNEYPQSEQPGPMEGNKVEVPLDMDVPINFCDDPKVTKDHDHPSVIQGDNNSIPSALSGDETVEDWKSLRQSPKKNKSSESRNMVFANNGPSRRMMDLGQTNSSESFQGPSRKIVLPEPASENNGEMIQRSPSYASRFALRRNGTTETTGAFSEALNNGDFSNIPIQKLSLTPPGAEEQETTKDLFFSSQEPKVGATEDYRSKFNNQSPGVNTDAMPDYTRGKSEGKGLIDGNEVPAAGSPRKSKGKKKKSIKKRFLKLGGGK